VEKGGSVRTFGIAGVVVASLTISVAGQSGAKNGEWRHYGGDIGNTRYSPLDQINASNFNKLEIAWRFKTNSLGPRPEYQFESTPLMAGGLVYSTGGTRRAVVALDAATGEMVWMHSEREGQRGANAPRQLSGRGLSYWTDGANDSRILYVTPGYRLIALNARTGVPIDSFGDHGVVDLKKDNDQEIDLVTGEIGLHSTPAIARDVIIVGAAHRSGGVPRSRMNIKGYVRGDPAAGRVRQRFVGKGFVELHRQHRRVGPDFGGRGTRPRLSAGGVADGRLLRRASAGERSLRREPRRGRSAHRSAQVAFPARASRHLGF
jgi:hypothetical protein